MGSSGRYVILAMIVAVLTAAAYVSQGQAQGLGGGFLSHSPTQWLARTPWYQRYRAPPGKQAMRKRKVVRLEKSTRVAKGRRERRLDLSDRKRKALTVPRGSASVSPRVTCEKAQIIVAAYGFEDVKAQDCAGKVLGFTASRDGKPFAIQIEAASGEFAKVRRLR
jgi:hypothetical protein